MELLGVKLDDEVLFYVEVDLLALGQLNDLAGEVCAVKVKPLGSGTGSKGLNNSLDLVVGTALLGNSNNVACTEKDGRNVSLVTVYGEMTVTDELTSFLSGSSKAEAVNNVVQSGFEDLEQVFAGDAALSSSLFKVSCELALENAIVTLSGLLSAQLSSILRGLLSALAVLAGERLSSGESALFAVASLALEEQLLALAAAESAVSFSISSHFKLHLLIYRIIRVFSWEDGSRYEE